MLMTESCSKPGEKLGTEYLTQGMHGEEEVPGLLAPFQVMPDAILVHATACDYAMDVRMVVEIRAPSALVRHMDIAAKDLRTCGTILKREKNTSPWSRII